MSVVAKHNANLAAVGMTYWAQGPVTGTMWALRDRDHRNPILVDAQCQIIGDEVGTPAQRKAAIRGVELTMALRMGAMPCYDRSGAHVIGLERPIPEHEHFYPASRWDASTDDGHTETHADGACSVFVPYDRNKDSEWAHVPATVAPVVAPAARSYRRRVA